ncbi:hypothetical protein BGZ60DRAFT_381899, partial [Tricladium varicosporioides]
DPSWRPRVHAELLLLDKFWRFRFEFVDNDRYIGTNQPACYCCYHYMLAHPLGLKYLTTHNKVYLKWKVPDIHDEKDIEAIKTREKILNSMKGKTTVNVLAQVAEQRGLSQ